MSKEEQEATPVKTVGITSRFRTPEEVEELRRQYLEGVKWEGSSKGN